MKNTRTIKKILPTAIAASMIALFSVGTAQATEHNWSGFYGGATFGAMQFKTETDDYWCWYACDAPGNTEQAMSGGLTGGYNWQLSNNFVVGIEADISTGAKSSERIIENTAGDRFSDWKSEWSNLGTIRGRAGLTVDRTMVFVTGGFAVTEAKYYAKGEGWRDVTASWDGTLTGLAMGVGVEHALTKNMSFKAEYLRVSMPKKDACWASSDTGVCWDDGTPQNVNHVHWTSSADIFRVGMNWKF